MFFGFLASESLISSFAGLSSRVLFSGFVTAFPVVCLPVFVVWISGILLL